MKIKQRQLGQGLRAVNRVYYDNIHQWLIKRRKKIGVCEFCKERRQTEFALRKGEIYKRDTNVFMELCISCHKKYDYTEEQRRKVSERMKGNSYTSLSVIAVKNGESRLFKSLTQASKELNIIVTAISNCLAGRAKTAGGYFWKYGN